MMFHLCKKKPLMGLVFGREEGIRTLETFRFTHFPGVRLQPLGHLSINLIYNVERKKFS